MNEEFERIESILARAAAEAKADFDTCRERFRLAKDTSADLGLNHPDGASCLSQATKAYNQALAGYRDALMAFNRFVLYGEIPEDLKPE